MDPSEFEDTVEKSKDAFHAGVLEQYFAPEPVTSAKLIDEVLTKFESKLNESIPNPSMVNQWESLVIEITEYDEKINQQLLANAKSVMYETFKLKI